MNELFQRVYDWYVTGPRQFYRQHMHELLERKNTYVLSEDCGLLEVCLLDHPTTDQTLIEATRRQFDRAAKNCK